MVMVKGWGDRHFCGVVWRSPRFGGCHYRAKFLDNSTEKLRFANPFMPCNIFYNGRVC
ncbi:hypothetical protein [[Limnothrix rosea] IAM M-220]|uniref:hypothetical protein n=1 Tax=[Limnothrix rosea] IAM M-220 TaxID=454133 RepID=UPI0015C56871|nr:hypothetical protein [[Limnothrix rosea] IAM M-220]